MKKNKKKQHYWNLYKMCVTLQIYLELDNAKWNLKFKPLKLQDVISIWALESHTNSIPINCDNFFKITAHHRFSRVIIFALCTYLIYHFFLLGILIHFFLSLYFNTSNYINPQFQIFSPTIVIFINENSQHSFIKNRGSLIWN